MAWISPNLIEVFRSHKDYRELHILYKLSLKNNTYIQIVQNFGRIFEFAMVTENKPQMIQFFNWYHCKQSDGKCIVLEPHERCGEIEGNEIVSLKYSNKTLIALTAR